MEKLMQTGDEVSQVISNKAKEMELKQT